MARPLRIAVADGIYHVTARGNAKQPIYLDAADRRIFLGIFRRVLAHRGWYCLSYCLMENHYHLLIETPRADLASGMRNVNGVYAQRFNRRHDRCGHVFQGRYSAVLVQRDQHLLETARYVALNPVRAGLCERADEWEWSSHRTVLGHRSDDLTAVKRLLSHFGDSRGRYRAFVAQADEVSADLHHDTVAGTPGFRAAHLPPRRPSPEMARRPWTRLRPSLDEIFGRHEHDEAMAVAFHQFGYRLNEIAAAVGCHYSTVSRRIRAREEP